MPRKTFINRNDHWLLSRLDEVWMKYFPDISQDNPVTIRFGRYAKYRLGSIKFNRKTGFSQITITSMFKNLSIPVAVIDHTIAHEMVHYAHGFSSNKRKLHKFPHEGGVVRQEMEKRGLGHLTKAYKSWVKRYRGQLGKSYG